MSNYGFHQAMADAGIEVATTPVGDRHVIAELEERGWPLGGEQSGHIIWSEYGPTGDGIAAALLVMRALGDGELAAAIPMQKLPQVLENVEVAEREALDSATAVWEAVERESDALEGRGRVLVRASGTEPLGFARAALETAHRGARDQAVAVRRTKRSPCSSRASDSSMRYSRSAVRTVMYFSSAFR